MKLFNISACLIFLLLFSFCSKEKENILIDPPPGCMNMADLVTKRDYYLPFALLNDTDSIGMTVLNGDTINFKYGSAISFSETGFYELILVYKDWNRENDTDLFTTKTKEREFAEWGIKTWKPVAFETSELGSEDVEMIYPRKFADSVRVPFVFYISESGITKAIYLHAMHATSGTTFNIKQGVGSVNLSSSILANKSTFVVGNKEFNSDLTKISQVDFELKDTINMAMEIPANSFVRITSNLHISSTGSLTIHEGTLVLIDEAIDVYVNGPLVITGTPSNPVFISCNREDNYWGGFITTVAEGTIEAHYTLFCQSGFHDSYDYNWGHAKRQALFYTSNSTLTLDHCYILDHIGQIFYPQHSTLVLDNILVQRAKTGGQINYSELILRNSVFTDFPNDSYVYEDNDNDALYLNASDAEIDNTLFMFAKDDGLDSGLDEGGEIIITNCRFETCLHEGAALSSKDNVVKNHTFRGCVFSNCGQGIELGFSSPNHKVVVENCMFYKNGIGIRYGDNYDWSFVNGKMFIRNSFSLNNYRDAWNMVHMDWSPKLENMKFENTFVSKICPQYPDLELMKK